MPCEYTNTNGGDCPRPCDSDIYADLVPGNVKFLVLGILFSDMVADEPASREDISDVAQFHEKTYRVPPDEIDLTYHYYLYRRALKRNQEYEIPKNVVTAFLESGRSTGIMPQLRELASAFLGRTLTTVTARVRNP